MVECESLNENIGFPFSEIDNCPECHGRVISDVKRGDSICKSCGLIISEKAIDISSEGRNMYSHRERMKSTYGIPITIMNPNIKRQVIIDLTRFYNNKKYGKFKRLVRVNQSNLENRRSLVLGLNVLKRICNNLKLPRSVVESTMLIFKRVFEKRLLKHYSVEAWIGACLYYICRKERLAIAFNEIVSKGSINANKLRKCYKLLIKEFNLNVPVREAIIFVPRYCSELNLNSDIEKKIVETIKELPFGVVNGRNPIIVCAAVIYLICKFNGVDMTYRRIIDIFKITEAGIRNICRELKKQYFRV
ncbi:MAG: transcription initiation factor IIB [Promethearchaeota archaeon]